MKKWIYTTLSHLGTVTTEVDGDTIELEPNTELYVAHEVDAKLNELDRVLAIVKQARTAGWYEEDHRWQPVDEFFGIRRY